MPEKPNVASTLYKAATPSSARKSGLRLVVFLVISLFAAIASALVLTRYMDKRMAQARVPTARVVVAATDLPVGAEIRSENLAATDWPAASVPEGAFQDAKELEGKVVAFRVFKGEPVLSAKLTGDGTGGLSALLPPGMRAAAVRVDDVVGVAGFVHPGDSVDVIVTIRTEGTHPVTASKVILQNIRVLAVGKELDTKSKADKVVPATVATLMVDAEQSERLALAAVNGKILLTLRSGADSDVVETAGITAAVMMSEQATAGLVARQEPASPPRRAPRVARVTKSVPPPAASERPPGPVVEILRGELFEKRKFETKEAP